jgi:hypothetical protein
MSDTTQGRRGARADTGAEGGNQLWVLLVCSGKLQAAAKVHHSLEENLLGLPRHSHPVWVR